jgi:hypothetical protein
VVINLNEYKKEENLNSEVNKMPAVPYQAEEYDLPF